MEREDLKNEVLKGFHDQFAQNQNHHQKLFIQFLSAILIVIVAYVIVLTNMADNAKPYFADRSKDYIVSYSYFHLYGAYIIVQIIFVLLITIALNMGYNYRRDQTVNQNIRDYAINDENLIKKIFSTDGFNTSNLTFGEYLPGFHKIFYVFMSLLQLIIWVSILFFLHFNCVENLVFALLFFIPITFSIALYFVYYHKYKKRIAKK